MKEAIYITWLSDQSGEGDICPVHIRDVLVDFIVWISAQSFYSTQNSACPWFSLKSADANQSFGSIYRIRLVETHRVDALP